MIVLLSPSARELGDVNAVVRRLSSKVFAGSNDNVVGNLYPGLATRIWLRNCDRSSPASSGFEVFGMGIRSWRSKEPLPVVYLLRATARNAAGCGNGSCRMRVRGAI